MDKSVAETWVKVIGIVGIVLGALGVLFGSLYIIAAGFMGAYFDIMPETEMVEGQSVSAMGDLFTAIFSIFGILVLLVSVLYIVASVNLLKYKNWARICTLVVAVLSFLLALLMFPFGIFGMIINVGIFVVLLLGDVAELFKTRL